MKKACASALLALSGCGPSPQEICGTGLTGALLYAGVAWLLLLGVQRVTDRLRTGGWQALPRQRGLLGVLLVFLIVSVGALLLAPQAKGETELVLVGAGANFITWALLVRLITGWGAAGAVLLGGVLCLGPAVPGAMGFEDPAIVSVAMWVWGGIFGAVPAGLILLIWLAAWLRRPKITPG